MLRRPLDRAKELVERGLTEVQIFDSIGQPYDLADLEQQAAEAENKTLPGEPKVEKVNKVYKAAR